MRQKSKPKRASVDEQAIPEGPPRPSVPSVPENVRVRARPLPKLEDEAAPAAASKPGSGQADGKEGEYRVGYCRPPREHQFRPGQSGNPRGRPRGAKNWDTIVMEVATRPRIVRVGDQRMRMCTREAVVEALAVAAITGSDKHARAEFLRLMGSLAERDRARSEGPAAADREPPLTASEEAMLDDFFRRASRTLSPHDASEASTSPQPSERRNIDAHRDREDHHQDGDAPKDRDARDRHSDPDHRNDRDHRDHPNDRNDHDNDDQGHEGDEGDDGPGGDRS